MIFQANELPEDYLNVLEKIQKLREELRFSTSDALHRWTGLLARMSFARAIVGSNTMEGINVSFDDAIAAVDRAPPAKPPDQDWHAVTGYREAMDYVIGLSKEDAQHYAYNAGTLLSLHYMMMKYDLSKNPGRYRPGAIHIANTASGKIVYQGPDAALVPGLVNELIASLNQKSAAPVIVRAAMAHLNLAMIHPFKDGNGRMARALQTMVLSKDGILSPVFSSIEEYVGRNSHDYYMVLAKVGQGAWRPERNALPWLRFCLVAHFRQAQILLRRVTEMARLWGEIEAEIKRLKLPERMVYAMSDAAAGLQVRNPGYRKQADVSNQVANLDLKKMVDAGLLAPKGEKRGRFYVASERLARIAHATRLPRNEIDPFNPKARRA